MRDLARLPKAHLHLHFTGSLRVRTLAELAERHRIRLPQVLLDADPLVLPADERGWFRFQRLYDAARACVRGEDDMRRVVAEAAADDAAEGSGRLEIQVDPTSYAPFVGGLTPALEIVLDEARRAAAATGVEIGVVVAASRMRHPLDARALARLAARHAGDGPGEVVGFGLSNDERRGDTAEFAPAFAIARRAGLASVPHGGELLGPAHVEDVLDHLRPDRLGHGVRSGEDPRVLARVVDEGVALEVCPASNVSLGVYPAARDVPLRTLVDAGATVALGADDPLLFRARLVDQYRVAREVHGFGDAELADLARASIRASRASAATRTRLLAGVDAWLADDGAADAAGGSGRDRPGRDGHGADGRGDAPDPQARGVVAPHAPVSA
ncbi:adenosine deaminase [Cellulomonas sp. NPDC057328]|uniref:adenosine deaminase n=1 Tax=Cellulomonas sp. NPDC057328 TaxID=3346101 RepID=UPI003634CCF9